jgi:hypothetical protein
MLVIIPVKGYVGRENCGPLSQHKGLQQEDNQVWREETRMASPTGSRWASSVQGLRFNGCLLVVAAFGYSL